MKKLLDPVYLFKVYVSVASIVAITVVTLPLLAIDFGIALYNKKKHGTFVGNFIRNSDIKYIFDKMCDFPDICNFPD